MLTVTGPEVGGLPEPSSGIDSQPWRAGTTTLFVVQARQATEDGGIDSWAP